VARARLWRLARCKALAQPDPLNDCIKALIYLFWEKEQEKNFKNKLYSGIVSRH
jgi:hypothetical protein